MKKLIAFYSRADENYFNGSYRSIEIGNTEKVAQMMAKHMQADFFKIDQKTPYAAEYATCIVQAKKDKETNARPELKNRLENIDTYDEIYLGYPNYWGTMPMAVFTFLEQMDWQGKTIHPFCTHEGGAMGHSEADLRKICVGADIREGLAIHGSSIDRASSAIEEWLDRSK